MLYISLSLSSMLRTTQELKDLKAEAIYGDIKSQIELGNEYLDRESKIHYLGADKNTIRLSKIDVKQALRWYKKASKQGSIEAEYRVGRTYHLYMEKLSMTVEWYEKGLIHKNITEDEKKFEKNMIESLLEIYKANELNKNYVHVLEKAANKGYDKYQLEFGGILLMNKDKKGLNYIRMAAEKEYMAAVITLGQIYLYEQTLIKKDSVKGIYWLKIAADKGGIAEVEATIALAVEYCKGENTKKDLKECTHYFNKAKEILKDSPEVLEYLEKVRKSVM